MFKFWALAAIAKYFYITESIEAGNNEGTKVWYNLSLIAAGDWLRTAFVSDGVRTCSVTQCLN